MRALAAIPGFVTPLALAWLSRRSEEIVAGLLCAVLLGWVIERRRGHRCGIAFKIYLAGCAALVIAAGRLLPTIEEHAWLRVAGTAGALTLMLELETRRGSWGRRDGLQRSAGALIGGDLVLLGVGAAIVRVGTQGLFTNSGLTAAALLVPPMLVYRPSVPATLVWMLSATSAVYGWLGFVNGAEYVGHVDRSPPEGVSIAALMHGSPATCPGARFFRPSTCPATRGSFYIGEADRTYRLGSDGTETTFLDGVESSQTLIERCDRDEVLTASFERKRLRLARLDDGRPIRDMDLPSHPATMLLDAAHETLYVSTSLPASLLQIDLASWSIVRVLDRYLDRDPDFSGIVNIVWLGDRIVGAYSSWYLIDPREGELFSVSRDFGDFRVLSRFPGAWGYVIPDPGDPQAVFLKAYYRPELWHFSRAGESARLVAELSPGSFYGVSLPELGLLVFDHWTTGQIEAVCANDLSRRLQVRTGGMGRMLWPESRRVYTPSASGYLTIGFPSDVCAR